MSCAKVHGRQGPCRRGLSLLEVLISTLVVGVLLVAALRTAASAAKASLSNADVAVGLSLAGELMSEIVPAEYLEPDETPTFGPESSEMGGSRAAFDDVDDYHGWNASPPESRDGTEIPDRDGWQRSVAVEYVKSSDLTTPAAGDQRVKRITVTVTRDGSIVAQLVGIRTDTE